MGRALHTRGNGHNLPSSVAVSAQPGGHVVTGGRNAGGTSAYDYATVAYNAATGAQEWAARYHGPGHGNSLAFSAAVSPGWGTVFVTGYSRGTTSAFDYSTVAYNAATGAQEWVARYHGPGHGNAVAFSVAVSPAGRAVFVTGYSRGTNTSGHGNATMVAHSSADRRPGAAGPGQIHGPGNGVAIYGGPNYSSGSVAVSPSGGTVFVVTGGDTKATWAFDYATVAYNAATGAQEWVARYHGPGNGNDAASSVAVSPSGRTVFVTGGSAGTTSANDYATVAYNAATGAQEWAARYPGPGNASSVAVSPSGRTVFVTGGSAQSTSANGYATAYDYATVAYDATTCAQQWAARYHGPVTHYNQQSRYPGPAYNAAKSVAVSPSGRTVFVTGQDTWDHPGPDFATVAYDATTGAQEWVARHASGGAEALAVPSLSARMAGRCSSSAGGTSRSPTTADPPLPAPSAAGIRTSPPGRAAAALSARRRRAHLPACHERPAAHRRRRDRRPRPDGSIPGGRAARQRDRTWHGYGTCPQRLGPAAGSPSQSASPTGQPPRTGDGTRSSAPPRRSAGTQQPTVATGSRQNQKNPAAELTPPRRRQSAPVHLR